MCNPDEVVHDPFLARVLAGATRLELKTEFNLSTDALYSRLKRLKGKGVEIPPIEHPIWADDKREIVLAKASEGLGATQIAKELGMSKSAVSGVITRARSAGKLPSPVPRKPKAALPQVSTEEIDKRLRWKETMVGGCRWIEGNLPWDWRWCGEPVISPGSPYCEQHHNRIHGIGKKEKVDI